jgi:hypothetical protein
MNLPCKTREPSVVPRRNQRWLFRVNQRHHRLSSQHLRCNDQCHACRHGASIRQSAESPTSDGAAPKLLATPGYPESPFQRSPAFRAGHPRNKASMISKLLTTYWKWPPGRRGILDPRNGHYYPGSQETHTNPKRERGRPSLARRVGVELPCRDNKP